MAWTQYDIDIARATLAVVQPQLSREAYVYALGHVRCLRWIWRMVTYTARTTPNACAPHIASRTTRSFRCSLRARAIPNALLLERAAATQS
jgi:hypothetical protein